MGRAEAETHRLGDLPRVTHIAQRRVSRSKVVKLQPSSQRSQASKRVRNRLDFGNQGALRQLEADRFRRDAGFHRRSGTSRSRSTAELGRARACRDRTSSTGSFRIPEHAAKPASRIGSSAVRSRLSSTTTPPMLATGRPIASAAILPYRSCRATSGPAALGRSAHSRFRPSPVDPRRRPVSKSIRTLPLDPGNAFLG